MNQYKITQTNGESITLRTNKTRRCLFTWKIIYEEEIEINSVREWSKKFYYKRKTDKV